VLEESDHWVRLYLSARGTLVGALRVKRKRPWPRMAAVSEVMGSSEQVHVVDALAITGDEGRSSLRKAAGSRQTGFDPQMSEWGNPARKGHPGLNT
jgi:hypothetical protein